MAVKDTKATQYRIVRILTKGTDSSDRKPDVVPRCAELRYGANEQIEWVIVPSNVPFTVRFKKETGSPFEQDEFNNTDNVSGPPVVEPGENDEYYPYSLEVEDHDPIDPAIIFWR